MILGIFMEKLGRLVDALQCYDKALYLNPTNDITHSYLGCKLE